MIQPDLRAFVLSGPVPQAPGAANVPLTAAVKSATRLLLRNARPALPAGRFDFAAPRNNRIARAASGVRRRLRAPAPHPGAEPLGHARPLRANSSRKPAFLLLALSSSAPNPKFAQPCCESDCELRVQRGTRN